MAQTTRNRIKMKKRPKVVIIDSHAIIHGLNDMASRCSFADDDASLASSRNQLCDVYATVITQEVSVHEPENSSKNSSPLAEYRSD